MLFPPAVETLQRVRDCCDVMQGCARESSRTGDCSANQPLLADLFSLLRRRKEKKAEKIRKRVFVNADIKGMLSSFFTLQWHHLWFCGISVRPKQHRLICSVQKLIS